MTKIVHLTSVHSALDIRIFHKECKSLFKSAYDVTLIAKYPQNTVVNGVKILAIKENKHRLKRFFFSSWDIYKKALASKASICHFHDAELIFIGILLRLHGKKVIYDVHEDLSSQIMDKDWINPWLRYPVSKLSAIMEWLTSRFVFSAIVTATPKIAEHFPSEKTVLVQNFPILNELENKTTPWSEKYNEVAYIGGIEEIRGIKQVIKALNYSEAATLNLAGRFSSPKDYNEVRQYSVWNRVNELGFVNRQQVSEILARSKAGLVTFLPAPNHMESQPNKMFEYMSAGIPVIASDFPLWKALIDRYQCGICVNPQKPEEIGVAIKWIMDNPKEAEQMGKKGRKAIEEKYNWPKEEKKLLNLYKKLSK